MISSKSTSLVQHSSSSSISLLSIMPSTSRLSISHFTEEKRVQTSTPNMQLGSKEYLTRRRERLAHAQVPTRSSKSGTAKKTLRHRKRRNDVKPSQPISDFIPPSSSISTPSTPAFMPRERMSPPPAPRASRNRVVDLGTPTPPPRRPRDGLQLTAGLLFHVKGSSTVTVKPVEDMTDDESDAWYENMRNPFKDTNRIRRVGF
ncbi:hypothetical protein IW261DRAFT_676506 [Armillaria novae-zelandiae]|uniref:Uncharacterized protein n=1 Tax=Armillaria novae-zelandiae TaxID=153914 RepID=A0AA39NXN8_9AGAR|nr:hypothetical protein IW261DRAFT_676506 [Armillaria novae-zelandiae]